MLNDLLEAVEEQERLDFRRLNRLYDRFLDYEGKGALAQASEIYMKIIELDTEMGLR